MDQKTIIDKALLEVQEAVAAGEYATFSDLCVEVPLNDSKHPENIMVIWGEENDADDKFYNVSIYKTDKDGNHKDQLVQVFSEDTTWGALLSAVTDVMERYEDIRSNRVNIGYALRYVEAFAKEHSLEISVDNLIDDDHLDVVWYGGKLLSFKYRDYTVSIVANGEVCIGGEYEGQEFYYRNKLGNGAFNMAASDTLRTTFKNDRELCEALNSGLITYENNNWFEIFVEDAAKGREVLNWVADDDNVLEAIDPRSLAEIMNEIDKHIRKEPALPVGTISLRIGDQEFSMEEVCRALHLPEDAGSKTASVCVAVGGGKLISKATSSCDYPRITTNLQLNEDAERAIQITRSEQCRVFDETKNNITTYCFGRDTGPAYFMHFNTDSRPEKEHDAFAPNSVVIQGDPFSHVLVQLENEYVEVSDQSSNAQRNDLNTLIGRAQAATQQNTVSPSDKGKDSRSH